jgi:hypothetical protein
MKNIGIALISAVLVLALGGCGSDSSNGRFNYKEMTYELKKGNWECEDLEVWRLDDYHAYKGKYVGDIKMMNHSQYNKLMKAMECDMKKYSIEAQLEDAKSKGYGSFVREIEAMKKNNF